MTVVKTAVGHLVRLEGAIDESFDRNGLAGLDGVVVLDLDGVRRITSYGVREWIAALQSMPSSSYYFAHCRPALVTQFNMVARFAGHGQLVSLYAPYVCTRCSHQVEYPIDLRHQHAMIAANQLPEVTCPTCGAVAELDDLPDAFFSYVMLAPFPPVHAAAEAMLDGLAPIVTDRLKLEKEVDGSITALWLSGPLDKTAHFKRAAEGLEGTVLLVLTGVTTVTPEGLEHLKTLTTVDGIDTWLVGVPAPLAEALRDAPDALGRACLHSVRFVLPCPSCGVQGSVNASAATLRALVAGHGSEERCANCTTGRLRLEPARAQSITGLPTPEPTPEVHAYLAERADRLGQTGITERARLPAGAGPSSRSGRGAAPPSSSFDTPTRLGRYEVIRRIATGGMGTVFLARLKGAGGFERRVAIKVMHPHIASDPDFVAMFLDEARLAARIHHRNVVPTIDIQDHEERIFLVMDYVNGISLHRLVRAARTSRVVIPMGVLLRIMLDVLSGLHAAHEVKAEDGKPMLLVHRDVSPHNILVGVDGTTRIIDFGIAFTKTRLVESTATGNIKGKLSYVSPEQLRSEVADRRSDVYSSGVVLWELLAGERLFGGDDHGAVILAALAGTIEPPSAPNPAVPPELGAACLRALSREAEKRYPDAAAFAEAIERAASAAGIDVASPGEVGDLVQRIDESFAPGAG